MSIETKPPLRAFAPWRGLSALFLLAAAAAAGPVDFGMAEVNRAEAARGIAQGSIHFRTEISQDPPESYRIDPGRISGGDLRGLMYGLLEAAGQIQIGRASCRERV